MRLTHRITFRFNFLIAFILCLSASLLGLTIASSAALGNENEAITWSVRPANAQGIDGRSWAELELEPGESANEYLAVRNLSDQSVTFSLTAADGYLTDNGRFNMLPSDQQSIDAGTWIQVDDSVTIESGQTVVVPYTINVPGNAEPGDHAAGIAASVLSAGQSNGNQVGVESRVGFRVMTRVAGELKPSLQIADVHSQYAMAWNPFAPGNLTLNFELVNAGNVRLDVTGFAKAAGQQVAFPSSDQSTLELLPGDRKAVTLILEDIWPIVRVPATIVVDPVVVTPEGFEAPVMDPIETQFGVWAAPWPQLIALAGALLLIGAVITGRVRSRRRVARLVAEAHAEGVRNATAANQTASNTGDTP